MPRKPTDVAAEQAAYDEELRKFGIEAPRGGGFSPHPRVKDSPAGSITGHNRTWSVRVPLGRDPVTGKPRNYYKTVRGAKKEAVAFLEWYNGLVAAGIAPADVISQGELQELAALDRRAAELREELLARVDAGAIVQPGPQNLVLADIRHLG